MSVPRLSPFVAGRWRDSSAISTRSDPADQRRIVGEAAAADAADVTDAFAAAVDAGRRWAQTGIGERAEHLERFLAELEARAGELATAITLEMGKPIREARAEVARAIETGRYQVRSALADPVASDWDADPDSLTGWEEREPLGVVALITPWNFPVATVLRKLIPALVCGNAAILKPADLTPLSMRVLLECSLAAAMPPGLINCLPGPGRTLGPLILGDPRLAGVSFTGSTEVGTGILETLAGRDVPAQMELGGKNAAVVLADADLPRAAAAIAEAAYLCAGQWCVGTSRVIAVEPIATALFGLVAEAAAARRIGAGIDEATELGPMASRSQLDIVRDHVDRARSDGATLLTGGEQPDDDGLREGLFYRPTVFTGVERTSALATDEVFGPVVAGIVARDLDDAIELTNEVEYGLSAAIFTSSRDSARRFVAAADVGRVSVNAHTGASKPELPLGGRKASGRGEPENGASARRFFTRHKTVYLGGPDWSLS